VEAPVRRKREVEIAAPPEVVWDVLTGFEQWPDWNPDVKSMSFEGPVAPGSEFRWNVLAHLLGQIAGRSPHVRQGTGADRQIADRLDVHDSVRPDVPNQRLAHVAADG
jgi:uncharacterized membrane protein